MGIHFHLLFGLISIGITSACGPNFYNPEIIRRFIDPRMEECFEPQENSLIFGINPLGIYPYMNRVDNCSQLCLDSQEEEDKPCRSFHFVSDQQQCTIFGSNSQDPYFRTTWSSRFDAYELREDCPMMQGEEKIEEESESRSRSREREVKASRETEEEDERLEDDLETCFGSNAIMEQMAGFRIPDVGVPIENIDLNRCRNACRNDQYGRSCVGAEYDKNAEKCYLHSVDGGRRRKASAVRKHRQLVKHLDRPNSSRRDQTLLRKICLSGRTRFQCRRYISTFPQSYLSGYNEKVLTRDSYDECVEACVIYDGNSPCKSGMYYKVAEQNCILNFESHVSSGDSLKKEKRRSRTVKYFSLHSC